LLQDRLIRKSVHVYFENNLFNHFFGYFLAHLKTSLELVQKKSTIKQKVSAKFSPVVTLLRCNLEGPALHVFRNTGHTS